MTLSWQQSKKENRLPILNKLVAFAATTDRPSHRQGLRDVAIDFLVGDGSVEAKRDSCCWANRSFAMDAHIAARRDRECR